jgi:uncharacterized metal-binding protein YceD (DUF177 family)
MARLAFAPEETPGLPADFEAAGCEPSDVDLKALVEDELLLSLPLIAQHGPEEPCDLPAGATPSPNEAPPPGMRRPFAGLKDLLKQ